jgi:hypothetical protein
VLLDKDGEVSDAYDVVGIPTYIFINKKGYIRLKDHSFTQEEYKTLINE